MNTAVDPVQEDIEEVGEVIQDQWVSVVIPLDDYDMDRSQVTQLLFDTLGTRATVFIDNLYFSGEPQVPPPIVGTWKLGIKSIITVLHVLFVLIVIDHTYTNSFTQSRVVQY